MRQLSTTGGSTPSAGWRIQRKPAQQLAHGFAGPAQRPLPTEQPAAGEFGKLRALPPQTRAADEAVRGRRLPRPPDKQRQVLAGSVVKHAERYEFGVRRREPGLLEQFAAGRGGELLTGFGNPLRDVPARRTGGVPQEDALAVGD